MIVAEHPMYGKIPNVKYNFDGETGELKSVEMIKDNP